MSSNHKKNTRRSSHVLGAILAVTVAPVAFADIFVPLDDFNDGNDDNWRHVDEVEGVCDFNVFDASSGEYMIGSPCDLPENTNAIMAAIYQPPIDRTFDDGAFGVQTRHLTRQSVAWMMMRTRSFEGRGLYGYRFDVPSHGRSMKISWTGDPAGEMLLAASVFHEPLFEYGDRINMEASVVGNRLTFKVWKVTDAEPIQPQLVAESSVFPRGDLTLGVAHHGAHGPMGVAFDDVYFMDPAAAGDTNDDGRADTGDLLAILMHWGFCDACPEDLNFDGVVDFADMLIVLANWSE